MNFRNLETLERLVVESGVPAPFVTVSEWCRENFVFPAGFEAFSFDKAPYQEKFVDVFHEPGLEKITVMASAQVMKTFLIQALICYGIMVKPCHMLVMQPTLDTAEKFSKKKVAYLFRDIPVIAERVGKLRSRDSGNTLLDKNFPGGSLTMVGANSPAAMAMLSIRWVFFDEVDRYPASAEDEGDPIVVCSKRAMNFRDSLIITTSTPTIVGESRIEREFKLSDQRYFFVPCPKCGGFQTLKFERLLWEGKGLGVEKANFDDVVYECEHCGEFLRNYNKEQMVKAGEWRATREGVYGHAGFHMNRLYSLMGRTTWADIAKDFEANMGVPETEQVFFNTVLGLCYERKGDRLRWEVLLERARKSKYCLGQLEAGVLFLMAGVDVQGDRLEVCVWGWGVGLEGWLVDHKILPGDPLMDDELLEEGDRRVWQDLEVFLRQRWVHPSGAKLGILSVCVDTGHWNENVYPQILRRRKLGLDWYAVKGAAGWHRTVAKNSGFQEVNYEGQKLKHGIELWILGIDRIKFSLYSGALVERKGQRYLHLPCDVDADWCRQFCAEVLVTEHRGGESKRVWHKIERRNEALDCSVYAYGAAIIAGLGRMTGEAWEERKGELQQQGGEDEDEDESLLSSRIDHMDTQSSDQDFDDWVVNEDWWDSSSNFVVDGFG